MAIYRQSQHRLPFLAARRMISGGPKTDGASPRDPALSALYTQRNGDIIHAVFEALYELPRSVARRATRIADCHRWLWWWQRDQFQQRNGNRFICDSLSSRKWPSDIAS